jgi:hypothetical protein
MNDRVELLVSMVRFKIKTKFLCLTNIISKESFNSWVFFYYNFFLSPTLPFSKWIDRSCYNPSILDSKFGFLAMGNYYHCSNICSAIIPCQNVRCEPFFLIYGRRLWQLVITRRIWVLVCDDKSHHGRTLHNCWSNIWLWWYQRTSGARKFIHCLTRPSLNSI